MKKKYFLFDPRMLVILAILFSFVQQSHAQLSGNYVIGGGNPDYNTVSEAVSDLIANGVSGPVVMNIAEGTYTEKIYIRPIPGTSSVNTVTFQALGERDRTILEYHGTFSYLDNLIYISGGSHVSFKNLTMRTSGVSAGIFSVNSSHITFTGNDISSPDATALLLMRDNYGGITISYNKLTSLQRGAVFEFVGNLGTEGEKNYIFNNFFISTTNQTAVRLSGNAFLQFHYNSISNSATGAAFNHYHSYQGLRGTVYATGSKIFNNIFYSISGSYSATGYEGVESDYNNYFTRSRDFDLLSFQQQSGTDANSLNYDPYFSSSNDLHSSSPALVSAGIPVEGVTTDIDGELRDISNPSIGADEYSEAQFQPLTGEYTISKTDIGSRNFTSFNEAVTALEKNGMEGPVKFRVKAGDYNEQFSIGRIVGSSAGNTLTFESDSGNAEDVNLSFTSTTWDTNFIINLDYAKHIILRNLSLKNLGTYFGNAILLQGRVQDVLVEECNLLSTATRNPGYETKNVIEVNTISSENLRFFRNSISGGEQGILMSNKGEVAGKNNSILENTFSDSYYAGVSVINQNDLKIKANLIEGPLEGRGIFANYCSGSLEIIGNHIHPARGAGITLTNSLGEAEKYGIIANNFITSIGTGLDVRASSYQKIYHNTIHNTHISSTAGTPTVFIGGAANYFLELKNNLFTSHNNLTLWVPDPSDISLLDHNGFYTSGKTILLWESNDINTLSALTDLYPDHSSLFADPLYVNETDLHAQAGILANAGASLTETVFSVDIDGDLRDDTPSIGADEFKASETIPMAGEYSIDPNGTGERNFLSINKAVSSLQTLGISEAVTFKIASGKYNEQVIFPYINGASSSNTISFESASSKREDVLIHYAATGEENNYLIKINNGSYYRLKNLSFKAEGEVYIKGLTSNRSRIEDLVVDNCFFTSRYSYLVGQGHITLDPLYGGDFHIINNKFTGGYSAINITSTTTVNVENNIIDTEKSGIGIREFSEVQVRDNFVKVKSGTGIGISSSKGQVDVRTNQVSSFGYGISISGVKSPQDKVSKVINNYVLLKGDYASAAFSTYSNDYQKILNNTFISTGRGAGVYYDGRYSVGNELVNNIIQSQKDYAIEVNVSEGLLRLDYNNYFTEHTYFAYWDQTQIADFNIWKTTTGTDLNSHNVDPLLESEKYPYFNEAALFNAGLALAEVGTDFEADIRDESPSIGADEHDGKLLLDVTITGEGRISRIPEGLKYPSGTEVTLTATPEFGYKFHAWEGDFTSRESTTNFTVDSAMNLTAVFVKDMDLTYTKVDPLCPENSTGSIDLIINGGASPYIIDWSHDGLGEEDPTKDTEDLANIPAGIYTVQVTDAGGSFKELTVELTASDEEAPWPFPNSGVTISLSREGTATLTTEMVEFWSYDNCKIESMELSKTEFGCNDIGVNTVVFTVRDSSGNSASADVEVTVEKGDYNGTTELPAIADKEVVLSGSCDFIIPDYTGEVSGAATCAQLTYTQSPEAGTVLTLADSGIEVIVTGEDELQNKLTSSFILNVLDETPPQMTVVEDKEVKLESCEFTIPDYSSETTASDSCGEVTMTQSPAIGTTISGHQTIQLITLTATDEQQNATEISFWITLLDEQVPQIETISDQVLTLDENCEAVVPDYSSLALVTDNCSTEFTINQDPPAETVITESAEIFLVATDAAGNFTSTTFWVNLEGGAAFLFYLDQDGDGFGVDDPSTNIESCRESEPGYSTVAGDCDDNNLSVHPGAFDIRGDGIDQDCSGADELLSCIGNDRLDVNQVCPIDSSQESWVIFNPSSCAVEVLWETKEGHDGSFVAYPGETKLDTPAGTTKTLLTLFWQDKSGVNKRSIIVAKDVNCSGVISASLEASSEGMVYPNPIADNGFWIDFPEEVGGQTFQTQIFNLNGQVLLQGSFAVPIGGGEMFWEIDHSFWEAGTYPLLIQNGIRAFRIHLMVVK